MTQIPRRKTEQEQAEADRSDRRQFFIVAVVFTAVLVALTGLYALGSELTDPPNPSTGAVEQEANPALDVPDGGHAPTDSGDRGGSQQIVLMVGLTVVLAGGAAYVVYSSRRARRRLLDPSDDVTQTTVEEYSVGDPVEESVS